jgi:Lon protease-like protein
MPDPFDLGDGFGDLGLAAFTGTVRLFPLPSVVLFPSIVQPMHIFELRYRELMKDALAGDRLIAIAHLLPGWQKNYEGRPPIGPTICIGQIASHTELPDGRFNLLLAGKQRARITRELPPDRPFRLAHADLLFDEYPAAGAAERPRLTERLHELLAESFAELSQGQEQLRDLLAGRAPLGLLTDLVASALEVPPAQKFGLLEELNVDARARTLIEILERLRQEQGPKRKWKYPGDESLN